MMRIPKYRYDDNSKLCKGFTVKYSKSMNKWITGFDVSGTSIKKKIEDIKNNYIGWGNTCEEAVNDFIKRCEINHKNVNY